MRSAANGAVCLLHAAWSREISVGTSESLFGSLPAERTPGWRTLEYLALIRVLIVSTLVLIVAAFGRHSATAREAPRLLAVGLVYFLFAATWPSWRCLRAALRAATRASLQST